MSLISASLKEQLETGKLLLVIVYVIKIQYDSLVCLPSEQQPGLCPGTVAIQTQTHSFYSQEF